MLSPFEQVARAVHAGGDTRTDAARPEANDDAIMVGPMRVAGAGSARSRLARVGGRACGGVFVRVTIEIHWHLASDITHACTHGFAPLQGTDRHVGGAPRVITRM